MDTVFFIISKIFWSLIRPETWIAIGLALTLWGLWSERLRLARGAAGLTFICFVTIGVFPLGDLLLRPLESRYPAAPPLTEIAGIIVLGGSEETGRSALWGQSSLNDGSERLTAAYTLAMAHPDARLIYTGGSGALRDLAGAEVTEAAVARAFLIDLGLPADRIEVDAASRNTAENARLSLELAGPQEAETWVLVTSAFHMPRAMQSFAAAGWTGIVPWPVDYRSQSLSRGIGWDPTRNLLTLNTAIREWLGALTYRMTGR